MQGLGSLGVPPLLMPCPLRAQVEPRPLLVPPRCRPGATPVPLAAPRPSPVSKSELFLSGLFLLCPSSSCSTGREEGAAQTEKKTPKIIIMIIMIIMIIIVVWEEFAVTPCLLVAQLQTNPL